MNSTDNKRICGHEISKDFLDRQVVDLTAQSFVFVGPEKVGRKLLAEDFAKKLMCLNLKNSQACGQCPSCLNLEKGLNPDFLEISFSGNQGLPETVTEKNEEENDDEEEGIPVKKKIVEAKEIKIEEIEPLLEFLQYKPQIAQKRVAIIDSAERLSAEAASYLLKTVEEPPPESVLIFLVNDIQRLPETLVSRLLKITCKEVPISQIEKWLKTINEKNTDIAEIAWRSRGLPGLALILLNDKEELKKIRIIDKDFLELIQAPFYKQNPILENLSKIPSLEIENIILEWLFILKYYLERQPKTAMIALPIPKYSQSQLAVLASNLNDFIDWNRRSGINKRLWLENIFLKLPTTA
jgi:DNA polymerase III delta prime subunit